jgi:hypothetical protein
VGKRGDFSAVYLGHRWVLTAAHVGAASVQFAGREYAAIESSITTIADRNGAPSDLVAFRIDRGVGSPGPSGPPLPLLPIARSRPPIGSPLILIGNGLDRGEELRWTGESGRAFEGWRSAATRHLRWGTNRLDSEPVDLTFRGIRTAVLAMTFSPPNAPDATPHEAQAVVGDSGGAVFVSNRGRLELGSSVPVRQPHLRGRSERLSRSAGRAHATRLRRRAGQRRRRRHRLPDRRGLPTTGGRLRAGAAASVDGLAVLGVAGTDLLGR